MHKSPSPQGIINSEVRRRESDKQSAVVFLLQEGYVCFFVFVLKFVVVVVVVEVFLL